MILQKEIGGLLWSYRDDTSDLGIIKQNFVENSCWLPEDMTGVKVLDIGAHIGSVSLLAASRGASVVAYEPSFESFRILQQNCVQNEVDVNPVHCGIGIPGERKLYLDPYNTGQNSAFVMFPELNEDTFEWIIVVSLLEALSLWPADFVKIDCEGCEDEIFEQFPYLVKLPAILNVEFHRPERRILDALAYYYHIEQRSNDGYVMRRF